MVSSGGATEKIPTGIDLGIVRLVAQCLNHYATPGPLLNIVTIPENVPSNFQSVKKSVF